MTTPFKFDRCDVYFPEGWSVDECCQWLVTRGYMEVNYLAGLTYYRPVDK
jgi:hypothetical protein